MGGAPSVSKAELSKDQAALVKLVLPVYYTEDSLNAAEVTDAKFVWDAILNDTAPAYLAKKKDVSFQEEYGSCVTWFFSMFYTRLFDVHPSAKVMFKAGIKSQGKFLVQMLTLALTLCLNEEKLNKVMLTLAEKHNERGVKAIEYGVVGDVLFWSLRHCAGDIFNHHVYFVWTKIMSRILRVMVPCALAYELTNGINQQQRIDAAEDSLKKRAASERTSAGSSESDTGTTDLDPDSQPAKKAAI